MAPKSSVNKEQPFKDKCFLYRFRIDEEGGTAAAGVPQAEDLGAANEHIREALSALFQRGPDATLRIKTGISFGLTIILL